MGDTNGVMGQVSETDYIMSSSWVEADFEQQLIEMQQHNDAVINIVLQGIAQDPEHQTTFMEPSSFTSGSPSPVNGNENSYKEPSTDLQMASILQFLAEDLEHPNTSKQPSSCTSISLLPINGMGDTNGVMVQESETDSTMSPSWVEADIEQQSDDMQQQNDGLRSADVDLNIASLPQYLTQGLEHPNTSKQPSSCTSGSLLPVNGLGKTNGVMDQEDGLESEKTYQEKQPNNTQQHNYGLRSAQQIMNSQQHFHRAEQLDIIGVISDSSPELADDPGRVEIALQKDLGKKSMPSPVKKRGRPSADDRDYIIKILIENKNKIVVDGKLIGKNDPIWRKLKEKYNVKKSPEGLHTLVSCDRYNLKYLLGLSKEKSGEENIEVDYSIEEQEATADEDEDNGLNNSKRKMFCKRPSAGEKIIKLGEDMVEKDLKATPIRKEMDSEMMDLLDDYPAHIPSNEVGKQITREALNKRRIDNDPVKAIQLLKYSKNPIYENAIQEIAFDPFYVHITTSHQLKLYSVYCKNNYSRLIIYATGKLVQKLQRPGNTMSGHIFLYLGVVLIPGQRLLPAVQMLSERHNSNAIQYWLSEWVRAGAPVPNEVVLDDSAELISATCKALGKEQSTAAYIAKCFNYLRGVDDCMPNVLIRLNVAHLTNLVRKWPEIAKLKNKAKEFYIRVVILVAKATTLDEVRQLLENIFTVALSETEGKSAATGGPTTSEVRKKMLLSQIAGIVVEDENSTLKEEAVQDQQNKSILLELSEVEDSDSQVDSLKGWLDGIIKDVHRSIVDDGDRDNIMHAPDVAEKLQNLLLILPLWCSALPNKMKSPYSSADGAYVESEIGQLKNNLLKNTNRVDDFVIDYLKKLQGYYRKNNPDFPTSLRSSATNVKKVGIMKNGMDPSLKAVKVGLVSVTLTNTCGFDAACQVFATACIDSFKYTEALSKYDVSNTIIDVALHIAKAGVTAQAYRKRASVLATLKKIDCSQQRFIQIDCPTDCSSLLRQPKMPLSVSEKCHCSSPYCPSPVTRREIAVTPVIFTKNVEECMQNLVSCVLGGDVEDKSPCLINMNDFTDVPTHIFSTDPELSKKDLVCNGTKTRETEVGPHLIIEVISAEERLHNASTQLGIQESVSCLLNTIPRQLLYKSVAFYLRGFVGFTPPLRDTDVGHYRGYALRADGSWEIFDYERDKVINVDGDVKINLHILLYTV